MKEVIYGACAKHPNHSMINCTMCELEKYKVKEMTQETMTKEQWSLRLGMYKSGIIDFEDIHGVIEQQLSAERERYDELKSKYDALVMDNATLEYNAAEAEKHLPDVIKQFVDQERERAAKLVGALKSTILIFNKLGYPKTAEFVKQTIAEYDTQTKS